MSDFWTIYENMQEIVYVCDMDSYELVYINSYGRNKFGIKDTDDLKGKLCYNLMQGCSSPCSICTNSQLKPGQFHEWRYYNGMLNTTFLIKDTMIEQDGRRYRLELAIDIGETDRQKKAIKEFASNEAMVNDALRLSLAQPTPEKSIEVLLKHLGQSLRSDRVYIFEQNDDGTLCNTYEWCAGGVEPQKDSLQAVPFEVVARWYEAFDKNENIVVKSLESIKHSHPKVYETLLPQQVDTLVVSPLIMNDKVIGFYGVDNPPKEFLNHISVMFLVLGYFISSILRRRNLVEKLEKLSYYDQLTGALNRHGMNEFIANVDHDSSIGLIYCDVMGLKNINDTLGHLAGDELLVRAYTCLCDIFLPEHIFRIGGDEFLIMGSGVPENRIISDIEKLKKHMVYYELNFAIGHAWRKKCDGQITELLKLADRRMYKYKEDYYSENPNDRRKRKDD